MNNKVYEIICNSYNDTMWDKPIMGVAAGDDEYFDFLKEHIGAFHWSPAQAFALKYGDDVKAERLRVLCVAFPQKEETKEAQSKAIDKPADLWALSRFGWSEFVKDFSEKVEIALAYEGMRCAAIDLRPEFSRQNSEKQGFASNWSHRHAAFAAGLGTFGLSRGFITEKGIAVRLATFIVEGNLDITPRGKRGAFDWCLYYSKGICGACIRRCPADAINEKREGKDKCAENGGKYKRDERLRGLIDKNVKEEDIAFGCGLCQGKVPCMSHNPVKNSL